MSSINPIWCVCQSCGGRSDYVVMMRFVARTEGGRQSMGGTGVETASYGICNGCAVKMGHTFAIQMHKARVEAEEAINRNKETN